MTFFCKIKRVQKDDQNSKDSNGTSGKAVDHPYFFLHITATTVAQHYDAQAHTHTRIRSKDSGIDVT